MVSLHNGLPGLQLKSLADATASMAIDPMGSPPRSDYAYGLRRSSTSQDRESARPKPAVPEYSGLQGISQNIGSQSNPYQQQSKPSPMQSRYGGPDPQRYYGESSSYATNPNHPTRLYNEHDRSPAYSAMYPPPQPHFAPQRLGDSTNAASGLYVTAADGATSSNYDSRTYALPSGAAGQSPFSGNSGQLPWSQSGGTSNATNLTPLTSDATANIYQSSVSPTVPTGGMPFARHPGTGQSRPAGSGDEEYDGRTRNAKAQKRHREKRKAHVKHLEETVLALQNHIRSLSRNQAPETNRPYLSAGNLPGEHEAASSQNKALMDQNQALRFENEQLRARVNELQGMGQHMSTSGPPGMATRFGTSGLSPHIGSTITPINEDNPSRSLSFNLPSLTIGVKAENGGHTQYSDGTPSATGHMHYGTSYGHQTPHRYHSTNLEQSPPLQPLTQSNLLPLASGHAYHRYEFSPSHSVPGPSSFPPMMSVPSAHQRNTGMTPLSGGQVSYNAQAGGAYGSGYPPANSEDALLGSVSGGDGLKSREGFSDRTNRQ